MAPQRNNDRHSGHTGTIPKSKVRNNCNVPQEAVTPTRRDMASNLVSTSLDWVPVSEYNTRSNYNPSRKPANNSSDQELTDLDNTVSFESGYGRFVPVRPQPRILPLNVQNRENLTSDHHDDASVSSVSYSLHPYAQHPMSNGVNPHSNHAAAAVMIVNPTTPNAVAGNMSQPFNAQGHQPSSSRNNLTRNLNPSRNNNFDGNSNPSQTPPHPNSRLATKTVNLMNNMYDQGQGSSNNLNEHSHVHRESARALGEAIVAACPDAAAVERRLGQIREYIRVTSSLVDTMRNSEDEAFIEHTKEEYDELVGMVMKLKESESKLEHLLVDKEPENVEVPAEETEAEAMPSAAETEVATVDLAPNPDALSPLKKVTNQENEQLNKTLHSNAADEEPTETIKIKTEARPDHLEIIDERNEDAKSDKVEIQEVDSITLDDSDSGKDLMNDVLKRNIMSCVEKVALIEELKSKSCFSDEENQDVVVRPMSVQSNGSAFSENELWPNDIKNKMELSQQRLAALKQQQKRLLKYQAETKQQLEEMNRAQSQEILPSTSHDNLAGFQYNNGQQRMQAANQAIGVATTLPHCSDGGQPAGGSPASATDVIDDRYSHQGDHVASSEDAGGHSDADAGEGALGAGAVAAERRRLARRLRELQLKKQHMENMVSEFQKLQMATRLGSSHNTYYSSAEESADEEPTRKLSNAGGNMKNEDPFKLMEIKAIKTALQKTKDLMRSVENYEAEHLGDGHEDPFQMVGHSNIHDNKSEGGASTSGWSADGSVCRVRNPLQQRRKFTNEQQHHHQMQMQHQQEIQQQIQQQQQQLQQQHHQVQSHEQNIASLQELAQEMRMETEKIMGERARLKDMVSNKEFTRKQKKVNEEVRPSTSTAIGPAERRQMELRNLLAEKQKELEALLKKEKVLCVGPDGSNQGQIKTDSRDASIVNQSYNSEQEEPDSRSEQILMESQNSREIGNFRGGGDSGLGARSINTLPSHNSHMGSTYASDSDCASRTKSNHRNRCRRRQQERQMDEINMQQASSMNQMRLEPRVDAPNVNAVPPVLHSGDQNSLPYQHIPQSTWGSNKSNQSNDMRANQFTQNSHSQTMDRLLAPPAFPPNPTLPFNMMMPFGMGGCGCGCALWGAWCWQQLQLQQRDVQQLRDQLAHLEERWRAETASHTLNNQVPPGNRANNYWDNFRSYSRQNLLSGSGKANAEGVVSGVRAPPPQPLVARSHNALRRAASPPPPPPPPAKRNVDSRRAPPTAERSLSFSSAPDVLNLHQPEDPPPPAPLAPAPTHPRHTDDVNINRCEPTISYRNLNISNPIPEIIQSHANNINTSTSSLSKKKSSSKLPAKNSGNRRNNALDYCQASNINIASTSEAVNPNLASTSYEMNDKASTKFFDLLRENVYSEVTTLIGVNESHPDFLIQLFRDLQLISSDSLRQKVLQSIRGVLSQYPSIVESQVRSDSSPPEENTSEAVSTTTNDASNYHENNATPANENASNATLRPMDNGIVSFLLFKSEEICSHELLEMLASLIINNCDSRQQLSKNRLLDLLSKYEGSRVCDVSGDILESLSHVVSGGEGIEEAGGGHLQDVAGALNLFSSSEPQLHQLNCPYELWPGHLHLAPAGEGGGGDARGEGKVDLLDCAEMLNGELAEADQTCPEPAADALPDVVDADEATPTEAEAEWLGLDRVPTRLHMEESSEKQKD